METIDKYWIGTDLKFAISIKANGFDMDDNDYEITLCCGSKRVPVAKSDIVDGEDEQGEPTHFLLIDTTQFPSGVLRIVVTAKVPDDDFETLVRREVWAKDLCIIKHPW